MNPHSTRFDNPQCTSDGMVLKDRQEIPQPVEDLLKGCSRSHLQDDYPSALFGWKSWHLTEIAIKRDESSSLGGANLEQLLVGDAVETLVPHRHHIVA